MHSYGPELEVNVREALASDAERIAALCVQLGYDVPLVHVRRTLKRCDDDNQIFVAIASRVGAIGWIAVNIVESLTSSRAGNIGGLVVEDEYRSVGVGPLLLARAEQFTRDRGCSILSLRSNVLRERAHSFYERLGYVRKKSQHYYEKPLT